jgi:integrase
MARVRDLWKTPERRGRGRRWLAVWAGPDGRERTRAFATKGEADRYGAAMETDALRGIGIDTRTARVTIGDWCDRVWLPGYERHRPSTVKTARSHLVQIKAEFGPMTFGAVLPSHVRAWTARLLAGGYEPAYVNALHRRLAQVFADAIDDSLVARSPCSRKTSPGRGRQRPYVATTEQVWALCEVFPPRIAAAVLLGAFAGLRSGEACGLRVADVDFMRAVIRPAVQWPAEELKTKTSRTPVPVARSLVLELSAHVRRHPAPTVLTGASGAPLNPRALEDAMATARAKVDGLPAGFRYHDLRHYFASLLIASGADVKEVQARLRHASATTTLDTYGHLWPDRDESTRAAVDAVFAARAEQGRNRGAR